MESYVSESLEMPARPGMGLSVSQCGWQSCRPLHFTGPGVRSCYVLHYIVKGRGRYRREEEGYVLEAGQGFLIRPGEEIFYQADEEDPWEYFWVGFDGGEAGHLLQLSGLGPGQYVFQAAPEERDSLRLHISNIYYASAEYLSREYAMVGYLYLFFSCMIRQTGRAHRQRDAYLERAVAFIRGKLAEPITVEQVAAHVGIERSYLYRIFKEDLGQSVKEYVDRQRLARARELLDSTGLPVGEVGAAAGFGDSGHFSRKFRELYGVSPAAYRKALDRKPPREE